MANYDQPASADPTLADAHGADIWTSYSTRARALLALGAGVSAVAFWLAANAAGFPRYPDFQASLLLGGGSAIVMIILVAIVLVACVVVTALFTRNIHFDAALFCAALGMLILSVRGGPVRYVLMYNPSAGTFLRLATESALLLGCVALGWYTLLALRDRGVLKGEPIREDDPDALPAQGLMALGAQVILLTFLMIVLAQTDTKSQVIWSIGISSWVAAVAAHSLFPARPSLWFWSAPFVVAILGYALAFFAGDPQAGGRPAGLLAPLARPLPLDYASVGTAAALLGYWTSRKWLHEREHEPHTTGEVEEALEAPPGQR
jgi:hypothetical protein